MPTEANNNSILVPLGDCTLLCQPRARQRSVFCPASNAAAAARIASETGALIVIITHTGKDADRGARGHSSLRAAADAELYVHAEGDTKIIQVTKMRDGSDQTRIGFQLRAVEIDGGDGAASPVTVPVAVPVALATDPAGGFAKPGTWNGIVLAAYDNAVNRFEDAELPGLPRETLLAYVCDAYRDVKVGEPPERWRDTAGSSLKRLVKAGVLSQVDGNFSRPLH